MNNRIHDAYRGEIYGIAFFSYFANHYSNHADPQLWEALINVEKLTAKLLKQYLNKHSIEYNKQDKSMQLKGEKDAINWIELPWPQLIKTLINWVEPYENKYQEWAKSENKKIRILNLLAEHETAIYKCWKAEMLGESGIPTLLKFINKY